MSETKTTALAVVQAMPERSQLMRLDTETGFAHLWKVSGVLAASELVPATFQGKRESCMLGCVLAEQMGENPIVVLQNMHVVKGKAGWSSQFVISRSNRSDIIDGRIGWRERGDGDDLEVTAFATMAGTGEVVEFSVNMAMAKAEAWTNNPKYKSMPKLMLRYRSAAFLCRLYFPEVMEGYLTVEELEDIPERDVKVSLPTEKPSAAETIRARTERADRDAARRAEKVAQTVREADCFDPSDPPPVEAPVGAFEPAPAPVAPPAQPARHEPAAVHEVPVSITFGAMRAEVSRLRDRLPSQLAHLATYPAAAWESEPVEWREKAMAAMNVTRGPVGRPPKNAEAPLLTPQGFEDLNREPGQDG